jgi:hypothetical protein
MPSPGGSPEPGGSSLPSVRIAAGATAPFTDPGGNVWSSDTDFSGGITTAAATPVSIANTDSSTLYNSERYGGDGNGGTVGFSYAVPMPAGNYDVTLKFAETYLTGAGQRLFGVTLNGQSVLDNFDIYAAANGMNAAVDKTFPVSLATDGNIEIDFVPGSIQNPKVCAIAIIPANQATSSSGTPGGS